MPSKFIGCFISIHPNGDHGKSNEIKFETLEAAQAADEHLLPFVTVQLAPAQVIWMVREIAV